MYVQGLEFAKASIQLEVALDIAGAAQKTLDIGIANKITSERDRQYFADMVSSESVCFNITFSIYVLIYSLYPF